METINQQVFTGERALFKARNISISQSVFEAGESPLKESKDIKLNHDIFRWKYPLWYAQNIEASNLTLTESARSGIWYTHTISIKDSIIAAPKTFRRSSQITLDNVQIPHGLETLWHCKDIVLNNVNAVGDYFAMNSENMTVHNFSINGNYSFDGAKNVHIQDAQIISKDAFWNCEDVIVEDSTIIGEYLGWNSKNITFKNCFIESEQGLCYMDNVKLIDCVITHTDLAFEYSRVDATIKSTVDSVKNPLSGIIRSYGIDTLITDDETLNPNDTEYITQGETI